MGTESSESATLIRHFREILLWPLQISLERSRIPSGKEVFTATLDRVGKPDSQWDPMDDYIRRDSGSSEETAYAEFVYFHPFVRRFLYPSHRSRIKRPLIALRRNDIKRVDIHLSSIASQIEQYTLNVDRVHLYLFETSTALLVVEVSTTEPLTITTAEALLDQFRRAYPPYWDTKNNFAPGHCPQLVRWIQTDGTHVPWTADYHIRSEYTKRLLNSQEPRVSAHWEHLLFPLLPPSASSEYKRQPRFHQILDDRIPVMAFLTFDDPTRLSNGDFMRLAFLDGAGNSKTYPYSDEFLHDFFDKYCYDRFWNPGNPATSKWMTTRYLCSGYSFVVIGSANSAFVNDAESGLLAHFRHHYLQMGLVVFAQLASLLTLADRLSRAVDEYLDQPRRFRCFRREIQAIHTDIVQFTHRFWFDTISNQVQAQELFRWWCQRVRTPKLYRRVLDEVRGSDHLLDNRWQQDINYIAIIGLALSVAVGFWGMNVLSESLIVGTTIGHEILWVVVSFVLAPIVLLVLRTVVKRIDKLRFK